MARICLLQMYNKPHIPTEQKRGMGLVLPVMVGPACDGSRWDADCRPKGEVQPAQSTFYISKGNFITNSIILFVGKISTKNCNLQQSS